MPIDEKLNKAADLADDAAPLFDKFVHGTPQEMVNGRGGAYPCLNKLTADIKIYAEDAAVELMQPAVENINQHAQYVSQKADEAGKHAQAAGEELGKVRAEGTKQIKAVQDAGTSAVSSVKSEGDKHTKAVTDVGTAQVEAVNTAGSSALSSVQGKGEQQTEAVTSVGNVQVQRVETAGSDQTSAVNHAGSEGVQAVESAGDTQTRRVNEAGESALSSVAGEVGKAEQAAADTQTIADKFGNVDEAVSQTTANAETATRKADEASSSAVRGEAAADRADLISGLETVRDALRLAIVPRPDFHLPLIDDLTIREGKGTPYQIDVSPAQDKSAMVDLPIFKADFSRASKATYINKQGVLVEAGIDEPRFEKDGVLVEGGSTNIIANSETCSGGTIVDRFPFGSFSGYTLEKQLDIANEHIVFDGSSSDDVKTLSLYIKAGTSDRADIGLYSGNWNNQSMEIISGPGSVGKPGNVLITITGLSTEHWTHVMVTRRDSEPSRCLIYPAGSGSTTKGSSVHIACPQLEAIPFVSSYIPTYGTPATRAADNLRLADNLVPTGSEFTISIQYSNCMNILNQTAYAFAQSKSPNIKESILFAACAGNIDTKTSFLGGWCNSSVPTPYKTKATVAASNDGTQFKAYSDGVYVGSSDTTLGTPKSGETWIGCRNRQHYAFGHIRELKIWNRALTPEQVANI